ELPGYLQSDCLPETFERLQSALAGRYAIERELGHGAMATVFLAQDVKLRRLVALKVLRPDVAATVGPERFVREIDIAAHLTHPHILALHARLHEPRAGGGRQSGRPQRSVRAGMRRVRDAVGRAPLHGRGGPRRAGATPPGVAALAPRRAPDAAAPRHPRGRGRTREAA